MFLQLKRTVLFVLCLSFCAGSLVRGMEQNLFLSPKKTSGHTAEPPSTSKKLVKKWVGHHCYKVLSAISQSADAKTVEIQNKQVARIKDAFREFFAMMPYDMQSIRKKRNDSNNNYTKEFYYALFYSLSRCLERCVTGESGGDTKIKVLKSKFDNPSVIYVPLKHNGKVFVIQFCICDENQLEIRKYLHNNQAEASIYVTVCLDGEGKYSGARVESQDKVTLSNFSGILIDKPIVIDQDEKTKLGESQDVYATAIKAIISNNNVTSFQKLLARDLVDLIKVSELLGVNLKPSCEHYYHCLLADILMFALASTTISEAHTYNGRIDIKLECENSEVIIFELKYLGTVDDAFKQIDDREYALGFFAPIVKFVGINLTKNFKVEIEARDHEKKELTNKVLERKKTKKKKNPKKRRKLEEPSDEEEFEPSSSDDEEKFNPDDFVKEVYEF